jgi:hypothetical protein
MCIALNVACHAHKVDFAKDLLAGHFRMAQLLDIQVQTTRPFGNFTIGGREPASKKWR